ncbi:MAG TPA: M1 family metallopeptidase, partial [Gemmatimonadaceae bacterium]|nr:M1 family metallopeptidase [Gemmatimonadaceae bacterium]
AAPSRVDTLLLVQPPTFQVSAPAPAGAGGVTAADSSPRVMLASESPFYPLARSEWPGPNQYRSASGAPGPAYWQQRADYAIDATLDTAEQRLRGSVTIRYTNNSPDTLRFVWLNIDQNVYKPGSRGSGLFAAEARASGAGFAGGYDEIADVRVDGRPARFVVSDTRMRVELERPLPPGGARATISVGRWSFRVPVKGSDRMGRDGALYAIAQWYPRVAVYDDVRGWNTEPYLGQGEFYTEFGDFDLAITVPAGYVVASTGVLRNPREVLTAAQRERLARAAKSEQTVQVIADSEARVSVARPTPGTKTWRYRAERVRDVAWAAAPDFRWDASSWKGVMLHAFYEEEKTKGAWAKAVEHSRWTIGFYSEHFAPYPYPQATSIATTIGGMEYPMLVFNPYGTPGDPESIFGVNDHELAHQWAPMVVGSNERRYEFMDEGFNSYMNLFSNEARGTGQRGYPGMVANWKLSVDSGFQTPVLFRTDHFHERGRGPMGYRKPAIALVLLRNHVIGRELFDSAFREYLRRWSFRHPTPGDFFRTVENVAGEDLSWFWRGFLYSTDVLDVGIAGITTEERNGRTVALVTLTRTTIPFPVSLRLALADGSLQEVRLPVDIWARGQRHTAIIDVRSPVVGARLWPDPTVPDWNQANDVWGRAPAQDEMGPVTSDGTTPLPTKATP